MKQTKFISKILHYLCFVLAIGYLGAFMYSAFCLITGYGITARKQNLHILYPFSDQTFLIAENNLNYIIFSFLLPILLYGIFFLLSTRLFKVFFQPKLFTNKNVSELRRFYIFNIFIPLPSVIMASFFVSTETFIWILVFIHFILGIFSFFIADIFKQGLQLQDEQDLYI